VVPVVSPALSLLFFPSFPLPLLMKCEVCRSENSVTRFWIGGDRPRESYRPPRIKLCEDCQETLADLVDRDQIHFRREAGRDTTSSRYSIVKGAIKRERFGNPNASIEEILKLYAKQKGQEK
jgi:hypothetical protein